MGLQTNPRKARRLYQYAFAHRRSARNNLFPGSAGSTLLKQISDCRKTHLINRGHRFNPPMQPLRTVFEISIQIFGDSGVSIDTSFCVEPCEVYDPPHSASRSSNVPRGARMESTSSYSTWRTLLLKSLRTTTWAACRERKLEVRAFLDADGISRLNSLRRTDRARNAHRTWIVHFPCSNSMPSKICSAQEVPTSLVLLSIDGASHFAPLFGAAGVASCAGSRSVSRSLSIASQLLGGCLPVGRKTVMSVTLSHSIRVGFNL